MFLTQFKNAGIAMMSPCVDRSETRAAFEGDGESRRDLASDQDGGDDSKDASLGNMLCE